MSQTTTLSQSQQNFVLVTAILASSMAFIDGTALNVALPALQRSLDLSASQLLWVVNGYTLFLASLILLGGSMGDVYGKKKIFLLGIILFTIFSIACGMAPNGEFLIIARALQGMGGALMVPGSLSIISASFPQGSRGKAIGTWSMFSAFTTILGPVLGGYLAGEGLWRAIFFINVPLGLACIIMLVVKVPEPARAKGHKLDWTGGLLATLGFCGLTYGFIEASEIGFQNRIIWFSIILGALLTILFVWYESKAKMPLMPLDLFKSSSFSGANAMTLFVYGALGAVLFFVPLNLIQVQGYPEQLAGLAILPFGGLIALLARTSGTLTDRIGARLPLIIGPVITGFAFLAFTLIGVTEGFKDFWTTFFPALALGGIGMGLTVVPLTTTVMNCVTEENTGIASGVNNTIARLAGVLALAILGATALLSFQDDLISSLQGNGLNEKQIAYMEVEATKLAEAAPREEWPAEIKETVSFQVKRSFVSTFNLVSIISAILCFLGALISWFFIRAKPKAVKLE